MRLAIPPIRSLWKVVSPVGFILITLIPGGCSDTNNSYYPLQEGYTWRYQIKLEASGTVESQRYYLRSLGERIVDDEQFHVQRSLTGMEILYRHSDSGLLRAGYLMDDGGSTRLLEDQLLIIPGTLEQGFEWENSIRTRLLARKNSPGGGKFMARVPAVNVIETLEDDVDVPAGRFRKCLKISTNGFAFHSGGQYGGRTLVEIKQSSWFARGVGLVKSVRVETGSSDEFGTRKQTMELESFNVP